MMVELMQPTLQDTICDPAMGSAGFIVESAKFVHEKFQKDLLKTEAKKRFDSQMFHGYDTDQTMLRIGAMNLMLHNVQDPDIAYQDSLSDDNMSKNAFSLILANPPFAGSLDTASISKSLLAITNTKKTELLFLSLFVRMLQTGGRCASIVPDGVLFGTSNAHVSIRKELVDNQYLQAVISMPSGVFKPYAGVSTAVLIFTKTNSGGTDKVWFYDMKADGFSLDDKRNKISDNDIPDIVRRYHNLADEELRFRKDQSFFVTADEIRSNGYDLSISKYKEVERKKVEYDSIPTILARLEQTESEYLKGYTELYEMLKK